MLLSYHCDNYKGFREAEIEVKPLTIFLGPNSSGKSSLTKILLLLKQTIEESNVKDSVIFYNGNLVNTDDFRNFFYRRNTNTPIYFSFKYDEAEELKNYTRKVYFNLFEYLAKIYSPLIKLFSNVPNFSIETEYLNLNNFQDYYTPENTLKFIQLIKYWRNQFKVFYNFDPKFEIINLNKSISDKFIKLNEIIESQEDDIINSLTLLNEFEKLKKSEFNISFLLKKGRGKSLIIDQISFSTNAHTLFKLTLYSHKGKSKYHFESDLDKNNLAQKYRKEFNNAIKNINLKMSEDLSMIPKIEISPDFFINILMRYFKSAFFDFKKNFNADLINYIGPIHDFTKTVYTINLDDFTKAPSKFKGDNIVDLLKDQSILDEVNKFLKLYNYEISLKLADNTKTILQIAYNGFICSPHDVGFGISQLLPVLVRGIKASDNSINIIEQPEVHLHPKMQAGISDFFIKIIDDCKKNGRKKCFLIETHSEYILKRLLLRIVEEKIDKNDVAIYFVNSQNKPGTSKISKLDIPENGNIKWPYDYYEDDLEDFTAFFKAIAKKHRDAHKNLN